MLIRPDYHHHADLEEPGRTLDGRKLKEQEATERSEVEARGKVLFKGTSKSETKSSRWRK